MNKEFLQVLHKLAVRGKRVMDVKGEVGSRDVGFEGAEVDTTGRQKEQGCGRGGDVKGAEGRRGRCCFYGAGSSSTRETSIGYFVFG